MIVKLNTFLVSICYKFEKGVAQFLLKTMQIFNTVTSDKMAIKKLKKIIFFVVILDILVLLFEYGIIHLGAFSLGMKTSEIVYGRTVEVDPKESEVEKALIPNI